jgi:hypothetical protein
MTVLHAPSRLILDLTPPSTGFGDVAQPRGTPRGWDLLGSVPVPLRQTVRDTVAELVAAQGEPGRRLKCCIPMGQGGRGPFERLRFIREVADFPDLLISAEHPNAFNRAFHARHVEAGAFESAQPKGVAPAFAEAGLIDPKGWVGVFALAPFVMLVDRERLGGAPVPRRWADLMEPEYGGQVVFGGWRRDAATPYTQFNLFFLLSMARLVGLAGLARLMANVPSLLHSAQMPRLAGTASSPGGVYILPWSLADLCPRRDRTEVVWPEDGALAYPLWLTLKRSERPRLDFLANHFHGAELAAYLNHNRYPALCPDLSPTLPERARFSWLGWDFLRHIEAARLAKAARAVAAHVLEGRSCA